MTTEPTDLMNELNHLTIQDLQLLTLIGQGVDNRPELVKASGFAERTVFRRVDIFRGVPSVRGRQAHRRFCATGAEQKASPSAGNAVLSDD